MGNNGIHFSRHWAMPNADTFSIEPILGFVQKYLLKSKVSIDPFARNSRLATFRNDLNPATAAEFHMEAGEFLNFLQEKGVRADLFIFDPPYSARQIKECYEQVGRPMMMEDAQARVQKGWRDLAMPLLTNDAVVLSFGWNSVGFGKERQFTIKELLLVAHGGMHNDTICMAERRKPTEAILL